MELSDILIISFTGVVAACTVAYALLTWRLVSETQSLRKAQTDPRLSVSIEYDRGNVDGLIELVIKNHGGGPAQNITLGFEGDPDHFDVGPPIDEVDVIAHGILYLEPHGSWRFPLGWLNNETFERAKENPWVFNVQYDDSSGERRAEVFTIDFRKFGGLWSTPSHMEKIARAVESMEKDMRRFANGMGSLRVITQTKEELVNEQQQRIEARKERR